MPNHHRQPATAAQISRRGALKAGAATLVSLLSLSHITPALAAELTRLAHDELMTGARLASILKAERDRWNALLAQVGPERMDMPGAIGEWSVKQLVAHLTWFERAILEAAQQVFSTGGFTRPRPEGMGIDEMNARIAAEAGARPTSDVLAEADAVFGQLLALLQACPDDLLNDPTVIGLPEDTLPWMGVANNSYAHYREHEPALRAWVERG